MGEGGNNPFPPPSRAAGGEQELDFTRPNAAGKPTGEDAIVAPVIQDTAPANTAESGQAIQSARVLDRREMSEQNAKERPNQDEPAPVKPAENPWVQSSENLWVQNGSIHLPTNIKNRGQIVGKSVEVERAQQKREVPTVLPTNKPVKPAPVKPAENPGAAGRNRISWFRYELDIRKAKVGYTVLLRKRLRWSSSRYSRQLDKFHCESLTKTMVEQIRAGRFTQATKDALTLGGISYAIFRAIDQREGRGRGVRASSLNDNERSYLARLERRLTESNGRGVNPADRDGSGDAVPASNLPDSSNGEFADMPNVH